MVAVTDRQKRETVSDWVRCSQSVCLLEGKNVCVIPRREVYSSEFFQITACRTFRAQALL